MSTTFSILSRLFATKPDTSPGDVKIDSAGNLRQVGPEVIGAVAATNPVQGAGLDSTGHVRVTPVNLRSAGTYAVDTADDCIGMECQHVTLVASTNTTITFAQPVRIIRVVNWDIANIVLVKNGAIASNTDATATRVGYAPVASVPNTRTFPVKLSAINIRSAGASQVSIEGFF